jgi:hypothetical protein
MFENAACTGKPTEWWYPVREGKSTEELSAIYHNMKHAMKICRACPERVKCFEYSIAYNEVGIWGGMGEKTRKRARNMIKRGMTAQQVVEYLVPREAR